MKIPMGKIFLLPFFIVPLISTVTAQEKADIATHAASKYKEYVQFVNQVYKDDRNKVVLKKM